MFVVRRAHCHLSFALSTSSRPRPATAPRFPFCRPYHMEYTLPPASAVRAAQSLSRLRKPNKSSFATECLQLPSQRGSAATLWYGLKAEVLATGQADGGILALC